MPPADQTPLVAGPLYGLRTWRVVGAPGAERLAGPHTAVPWPDGGVWLEATCFRYPGHAAPEHDCVCGLHAWHPDAEHARRVLASRREVAGVIECHGDIEVHPDGFRAQRARPHALVVTPMRNAALVGRLARAYDAEVVTVEGPRELAGWCRRRGLGLDPSVVEELLGPGAVAEWREASRRRTRRRVAGVAASVAVAALLALFASFALPAPERPPVAHGRSGEVTTPRDDSGTQPCVHTEVAARTLTSKTTSCRR
jgi:hypothetical protein